MSSAADNAGKLGTYEFIVGPAKSPLGETWIGRAEVSGGSASDLVTLRRFGADCALSVQELELLSEAGEWALSVKQEGVVPTTELVVAGQQLAWVRPYVLGEPLRRLLQHCVSKKQAPSVQVALRIVVDVLDALVSTAARPRHLSSGALVNCCLLGPDVIWISSDGRSRITDAGLLAAAGCLDRFAKHPDLAAYRAPEQAGGFLAEPRSDVFVAGILLWELISGGRRLFAGEELATVVGAVFGSRIEQPSALMSTKRPEDAGAVAVVMRALDRDPTRRFQGPREMLQAIQDLGHEAVAKRADVAAYLATVSNHALSREREIVAQMTGGAGPLEPGAQEQPAAAADARRSKVPLARGTDDAQVRGSRSARVSPAPGVKKPDGTAAERVALSARPSEKKPGAGQVHSPRRSWPVPANGPQAAGSQPTAVSPSSAAKPTVAGGQPAAASQRPGPTPNSTAPRPSAKKALVPGIKPVSVSPRPNTTKALATGSQGAAASVPPGPGQPARASKPPGEPSAGVAPDEPAGTGRLSSARSASTGPEEPAGQSSPPAEPYAAADAGTAKQSAPSVPVLGSEGPSGASNDPVALAAGAEQPADTTSDPKAAASLGAAQPSSAASSEATPTASPPASHEASAEPASDETIPSSARVDSMPILSIAQSKPEDVDEWETHEEPAPAPKADAPPADTAPSDPRAADAPTAEAEKGPAAEAASAEASDGEPETADLEPEQGRPTLPGITVEAGVASEAVASGEIREGTASSEKPSPPAPAAPVVRKEPDFTPKQGEAAVAAEPFLDEATTRALKPRSPLAVVLAAAVVLAGGLYWLSGTRSASPEQGRPSAQPAPQRGNPTVASAVAKAPAAAAPELPSAPAPSEAAPATAKEEQPARPEPEAEPTGKKSPISEYVAKRAKPTPTPQPAASEPTKVTKSARATKAGRKPAAGSVAPKKTSALDMLRRLDKEGN